MIKKSYGVIQINKKGDIIFDGINLKEIVNKYESPFYLMSEKQLIDNYQNFLKAFSGIPDFQVFYSVKTNFESEILKTLRKLGSGAEIAGELDFSLIKRAGFLSRDIIFDGPCKKKEEISEAIDLGIHCLNVESEREMEDIEKIASVKNKQVNIGIRVDAALTNYFYDKIIDTYKRKFGFPIDEAKEAFFKAKQFPHLNLMAIHTYIGSQMTKVSIYQRIIDRFFELASDLRKAGIIIKEMNIGGGFPAQSMRNIILSRRLKVAQFLEKMGFGLEKEIPSIFDFGMAITEAYNKNAQKYNMKPALLTEPGRCIVSNISVLVGKVINHKRNWVFTDMSINDLAEDIFFAERDFGFPGKMNQELKEEVNISGPTLSTADILYLKAKIPKIKEGDPLVIFDTGAYSIPRSFQFTQPRKGVYFKTREGEVKLIRKRETCQDVIRNQIW